MENCSTLEFEGIFMNYGLVFKVSRNFSTRLTLSESLEIDSTYSTFDSKFSLSKFGIFKKLISAPKTTFIGENY